MRRTGFALSSGGVECPICLRSTEANPCECGYDFETCDRTVAAERAAVIQEKSARRAWSGIGLLASAPVSLALCALSPHGLGVLLGLAFPFQLFFGWGWTTRGVRWHRAARLRLARATQPAALPAARVVIR
jgi:hypothetical protein